MAQKPRLMGTLGVALGGLALALVGCADLIGGIGTPPSESDGLVTDEETEIRTTPECIDYCNEITANCVGEQEQYADRVPCLRACNTFDEGSVSEPTGNTLACRAKFAAAAANNPGELCATAGPAGVDGCGGKCAAWCSMLKVGCPDDFEAMEGCEASCAALAVSETGYNSGIIAGNNIECRIYHVNAALEDEEAPAVHCPHTRFYSEAQCGDSTKVDCAVYCQNAMGACQGENAVYDTVDDCLATCAELAPGSIADVKDVNTIGCRQYHASAGLSLPSTHCPHASPTGDNVCGNVATGICESYCTLYEAACLVGYTAEGFADRAGCVSACGDAFADGGATTAGDNVKFRYAVATATEENSLPCRIYYAVKVLGNPDSAVDLCGNLALAGTCVPRD